MRWIIKNGKNLTFLRNDAMFDQEQVIDFESTLIRSAVHEFLFTPDFVNTCPLFPALMAAKSMLSNDSDVLRAGSSMRKLAWIDSCGWFYPPAAIHCGISPERLWLFQPHPADLVWTTIESLRCQSMVAVVAMVRQPLTRIEVRRLQLAAECGGGIALLVRPNLIATSHIYAAATRWLVRPVPGERAIQRWQLQLIHGHGWQIGQSFLLEKNRASGQTHFMRVSAPLVYHSSLSEAS